MNENREKTLKQLNALRGLFALEIIIGHSIRYEIGILYPLGKFMICSVAFFFFVSAYGMVISFQNKKNYLEVSYLKNKILYLFLIATLTYVLNNLIDFCLKDYNLRYLENIKSFEYFFKNTNWYIWQQIIFYIAFFAVYKYFYKYRIWGISLLSIGLPIIFYLCDMPECWCASSFAFAFGIIVAEYYSKVKEFVDSIWGKLTLIVLIMFGCASLLVENETLLSMVFMRNSICIASIIIMFYISKLDFLGNNPVSRLLTKYSLELYLSQFVWLGLVDYLGLGYWRKIAFVLLSTIITAAVIHFPFKFIKKITH